MDPGSFLMAKNFNIEKKVTFKTLYSNCICMVKPIGDLEPVYGFQWRHFGASYVNMHTDYAGHGVDQLAQVISCAI